MVPVTIGQTICRFEHKLKISITENQQLTRVIRSYSEKGFAHKVQKSIDFRAYAEISDIKWARRVNARRRAEG